MILNFHAATLVSAFWLLCNMVDGITVGPHARGREQSHNKTGNKRTSGSRLALFIITQFQEK
jgi:hypothetical protein